MTRAEKVREAQMLRAEGLTFREIGERMGGAATSTVDAWLNDPDGSRLRGRHRAYGGECIDCGRRTSARQIGDAAKRCQDCAGRVNEERNTRIFRAWERGDTAKSIAAREGMKATTVGELVNRYRQSGMSLSLHRRRNREAWPLIEQRWNEGATYAAIATELGTSVANISMMMRAMRSQGVDLPARAPERVALDVAEAEAKYRAGWSCARIAESMGCSAGTVWRYLTEAGVQLRPPKGGRQKAAA